MTESIYELLDLEVKRLSGLPETKRPSESFALGVEHAANIAFRMGEQFRGVPEVTAAILAAWPDQVDSTESVLIRVALRVVATELRIDLDTALVEAGRTAVADPISGPQQGCPQQGIGDHDCLEHGDVWPPPTVIDLAFCEPRPATTHSRIHVRVVGPEGRMYGGGIPGPALCGHDSLSWDVEGPVTLPDLNAGPDNGAIDRTCDGCATAAIHLLTEEPK